MKKSDIENILKRKMLTTSDNLLLAEPGTIEQSLLFLEFYSYERFRIVKMLETCNKTDEMQRWTFLRSKLLEVERKISDEREDIMLYEKVTNYNLTGTIKDCKIYNMEEHRIYDDEKGE